MKFTESWLRDHLDSAADLGTITDTLTRIGLELEDVSDPGAALAGFVVARVVEAVQHPNADRLRVCRVDTGAAMVTVVCGAPNARTGMMAVFAPPGSTIPATGAVLKTGEIRGVASEGMLLSAREMGLGTDHDGIVELSADAVVGTAYAAHAGLADPVIDIAVMPNRGDALSVRGIARDLAAAGLGRLKPWEAPAAAVTGPGGPGGINWHNAFPEACPWVLGRRISGLVNGPSPAWLASRLTAIGLRPISTLVDITNWFAIDVGRPLHVFDAGKVRGDLAIRRGQGETLRALDNRDYTLGAEDCVIADAAGVQSLGGIIGGAATAVDAQTTSVFVECALFDPVRIALSGRRHGIVTDARQRFERGVDPALPPAALEAATAMIIRLCGGQAGPVVSAGAEPPWKRVATLEFARLEAVSGTMLPASEVVGALNGLGFATVDRDAESVTVQVPSWRNDIAAPRVLHPAANLDAVRLEAAIAGCAAMEPQVDLIEEVLRLHGLDRIAPVSLPVVQAVPGRTLSARQVRTARARRELAGRGLLECVSFSFTDDATAGLFGGTDAPALSNPIAADLNRLRPTPLATLARAAARNAARGYRDTGLFEVGPGFAAAAGTPGDTAGQRPMAALLRTGDTARHWREPARPVDTFDAKADALAVLLALGVAPDSLTVTADAPAHYHPGRSGSLRQGPKLVLAVFGALHPAVCAALDVPAGAVGAEIMLDAVPEPKRRRRAAPVLPSLMPVRRDFAFAVPEGVTAEQVLRAVRGADRALMTEVALFDVYALPDGTVSLGVEVTLQPLSASLSEAELEALAARVTQAVVKATGATLR